MTHARALVGHAGHRRFRRGQLACQLTETTSTCCAIGAFDADRLIGVANSVTWPRPFAAEAVGGRAADRCGEVADDLADAQCSSSLVVPAPRQRRGRHVDQLLAECPLAGTSLDVRGHIGFPGENR